MEENRKRLFDDVFDIFSMLVGSNYVTLYDIKSQVTRYSAAIVKMVGLPGEYIPAGVYDWMEHIHPEDRTRYEVTMEELVSLKRHTYDLSYRVRLKDGSYSVFRFIGGMIRDEDGEPSIVGGMMISEGIMENTDRVTSMPNQHGFFQDLLQLTGSNEDYRMLMAGFGRLAHINEVYGYGYGSQLLRQVGECITEITGDTGRVYRMEGSKFLILSKTMNQDEMAELYSKIRHRLKAGVEVKGVVHNLIAYGGLIHLKRGLEATDRTAYICLLHAYNDSKRYRHGELVNYDGNNVEQPDVSDSIAVIHAIRESMTHNFEGFYPMYQPIFAPGGGAPVGAEVIIRWKNEKYGDIRPEIFLSEIEQDYAFEKLGYWILKNAMADGKHFMEKNPDFFLCANIFPSQLQDDYFSDNIADLTKQTDFPAAHLYLELTRECRLFDMETIKAFAAALREKGVRIGLDDFARGNAWLKTFREIEADYVKFGKGLVKNLETSEKDLMILNHLSQMTAACGAQVFVKGIKTRGMEEAVEKMPIRGMQGELLSEPLYFDEMIEKL